MIFGVPTALEEPCELRGDFHNIACYFSCLLLFNVKHASYRVLVQLFVAI